MIFEISVYVVLFILGLAMFALLAPRLFVHIILFPMWLQSRWYRVKLWLNEKYIIRSCKWMKERNTELYETLLEEMGPELRAKVEEACDEPRRQGKVE